MNAPRLSAEHLRLLAASEPPRPPRTSHAIRFGLAAVVIFGAGMLAEMVLMRSPAPPNASNPTQVAAKTSASQPGGMAAASARSGGDQHGAGATSAGQTSADHIVTLTEVRRTGRILTEPARRGEVPRTGALPGKIVVDENRTARLASPINGRVIKLLKEPGQRVSAGEALARIDAPELATALADARKAEVDANLKAASAQRMAELHAAGAVALKELQSAQAEVGQAQAERDRARRRLRQLNIAGPAADYYSLLSPIDGIVTERAVTLGQQVRAEESLNLFVISDLRQLNLVVDVPESQVTHLAVGQMLKVLVDGLDDVPRNARISRIGPAVDPSTRRVQVRANLDNGQGLLRPEMFVRAYGTAADDRAGGDLLVAGAPLSPESQARSRSTQGTPNSATSALEVPVSALTTRGAQTAIFVEREPGRYERIAVQVLAQQPDHAWVVPLESAPIATGAQVVSQGALLLDSELAAR